MKKESLESRVCDLELKMSAMEVWIPKDPNTYLASVIFNVPTRQPPDQLVKQAQENLKKEPHPTAMDKEFARMPIPDKFIKPKPKVIDDEKIDEMVKKFDKAAIHYIVTIAVSVLTALFVNWALRK